VRAELPDAHVTWMCGSGIAELVTLFGPDEMLVVDDRILRGSALLRARGIAKTWASLARRRRFDRILLAHFDSRYRLLVPLRQQRAIRALRPARKGSTNPIPGRYLGDEFARLLDVDAAPTGPVQRRYPLMDVRPRLEPGATGSAAVGPMSPSVLLVPGGARNLLHEQALRRWPADRYASLARELRARGYRVGLIGNSQDAWVRPLFEGIDLDDFIGRLPLVETLRLMRDSAVVVSHDTGPLHLARLVRAPVVALFGPTVPRQVVGELDDGIALWGGAHLPCRPCYDGLDYARCSSNLCMQDIGVDQVVAAVDTLMTRRSGV
jgi:heptosyltransferase II